MTRGASAGSAGLAASFITAQRLPVVIEPTVRHADSASEGLALLAAHRARVGELLAAHGGVLLRGFAIDSPAAYRDALVALALGELADYVAAGGVRHEVADKIYTSSDAPEGMAIPLHQELSFTRSPPRLVGFYCAVAPPPGTGQTTLGNAAAITSALPAVVTDALADRDIEYVTCYPPTRGVIGRLNRNHKTWREAYRTRDCAEVERACRERGQELAWRRGWLVTREVTPAFVRGVFHNQVHVHRMTPRLLGGHLAYLGYRLLYARPHTIMMDARMADGRAIPRRVIYALLDALAAHEIRFDWRAGDVLVVDNFRVMHGRAATGTRARRILAAFIR